MEIRHTSLISFERMQNTEARNKNITGVKFSLKNSLGGKPRVEEQKMKNTYWLRHEEEKNMGKRYRGEKHHNKKQLGKKSWRKKKPRNKRPEMKETAVDYTTGEKTW